jgi:HK97 family phage portal protein
MSFLHSIFKNQITTGDMDTMLRQAMFGNVSQAGISVSPETAMRTAAVYACIKVLSEDIGKLPLILYRRTTKDGRDSRIRATDHPLYKVVNIKPNSLQTPMGFRETGTASAALRGNACSFINRVGNGRISELIPLHPDRVTIKLNDIGARVYEYRPEKGGSRTLAQSDVLHVMGLSLNGWSGCSPITYAKDTIGLTQATERHGSKVFSNGARMGGILTYPGRFKDPLTGVRVGEEFDSRTSGGNAHRTIVLEEGMKWEQVTMNADDAQYLETRQFQIPEIARFWRMPLHKIGDLTRATFSNIEHQSIEYVVDTLGPWLARWEQSMNLSLLTPKEQDEYYFEFLVDGLLRGDIKSRYEAYSRGILSGFLTRNECRQRENLEWIDGLDEPLTPSNMALGADPVQAGGQNGN